MKRNEKLYLQLNELESKFLKLLYSEFCNIAEQGGSSMYLSRKASRLFDGKFYRRDDIDLMESLERKIYQLREKLGETSPGPVIALVNDFLLQDDELKDRFDGGRRALAKQMLERINGLQCWPS